MKNVFKAWLTRLIPEIPDMFNRMDCRNSASILVSAGHEYEGPSWVNQDDKSSFESTMPLLKVIYNECLDH
jgi:hypothetical protein